MSITPADLAQLDRIHEARDRDARFEASHGAEYREPNLHPLFANLLATHLALPRVVAKLESQHLKVEARRYKAEPVAMTGHGELTS